MHVCTEYIFRYIKSNNIVSRYWMCVKTLISTFTYPHVHLFIESFTSQTSVVPEKRAKQVPTAFLAHLSTKCSGWAIVIGLCPSSVVVRRPSCVVRRASSVVRRPSCVVRKLLYLNIFSSETAHWILTKLHRNDPWVVPYQSCSNGSDWLHK